MLSQTIWFYFLSVMLIASSCMVIFAPRMFLALLALFFAFMFSGLVCLSLNGHFMAMLMFILGCFILCPIIFVLMKKINRWNLPLKLNSPLKIIVSSSVAAVFILLTVLFVREEFQNSLFNVFNFVNEQSADLLNFKNFLFPIHLVAILFIVTLIVVKGILLKAQDTEEDNDV